MRIYREPMFGFGFAIKAYSTVVWFGCWVIVLWMKKEAKG